MIDPEIKTKLLSELEKSGNVYLACTKTNVARATYYRWYNEDPSFRSLARYSLRVGRDNLCDIAEHALLLKVKEKDFGAIKYVLSHNSPRYKPNRHSKVILEHRSQSNEAPRQNQANLTDILKSALNPNKDP